MDQFLPMEEALFDLQQRTEKQTRNFTSVQNGWSRTTLSRQL